MKTITAMLNLVRANVAEMKTISHAVLFANFGSV